jgi:anti-sigma factor RsiW
LPASINDQMSCRELAEALTEYLEGALPQADLLRFTRHVAACADCRAYVDQMRQTVRILGAIVPVPAIGPEDRQKLLALLRTWQR